MKVENGTKVVRCKWYTEVKYKVNCRVLPEELLRTWFYTKAESSKSWCLATMDIEVIPSQSNQISWPTIKERD